MARTRINVDLVMGVLSDQPKVFDTLLRRARTATRTVLPPPPRLHKARPVDSPAPSSPTAPRPQPRPPMPDATRRAEPARDFLVSELLEVIEHQRRTLVGLLRSSPKCA